MCIVFGKIILLVTWVVCPSISQCHTSVNSETLGPTAPPLGVCKTVSSSESRRLDWRESAKGANTSGSSQPSKSHCHPQSRLSLGTRLWLVLPWPVLGSVLFGHVKTHTSSIPRRLWAAPYYDCMSVSSSCPLPHGRFILSPALVSDLFPSCNPAYVPHELPSEGTEGHATFSKGQHVMKVHFLLN